MLTGYFASASALNAFQTSIDNTSNNLANVNTTGYKKDRAQFETLAYQTITAPGSPSTASSNYATGLNLGTGVRIQGTERVDTQGAMQTTGNSLDMALKRRCPDARPATPLRPGLYVRQRRLSGRARSQWDHVQHEPSR